jgi:uncharacterized protein (DUF427 family)
MRGERLPGPDHPITIAPAEGTWRAVFDGRVVAQSERALRLQEADYPPVIYFPPEDVDLAVLKRTSRSSHCPYKGDASYFSIGAAGSPAGENAAWGYEQPYDAVAAIRGRLAFYADRVEVGPAEA